MKNILIIALPRSGGTALMEKLAKENNLKSRFEPELKEWPVSIKNDVTKVIVDRFSFLDIVAIAENYDKVILHSRHDIEATAESLANMHWGQGREGLAQRPWHSNDLLQIPQWFIEQANHRIVHCQLLMHVLSDELKLPIQYYENLFDENSNDRLRKFTENTSI